MNIWHYVGLFARYKVSWYLCFQETCKCSYCKRKCSCITNNLSTCTFAEYTSSLVFVIQSRTWSHYSDVLSMTYISYTAYPPGGASLLSRFVIIYILIVCSYKMKRCRRTHYSTFMNYDHYQEEEARWWYQ